MMTKSISSTHSQHEAIGFVRAVWKTQKNQIFAINYASGFAVSRNCIFTCYHNIYESQYGGIATQVIFIPGVDGRIDKETLIFTSKRQRYYRAKPLSLGQSLRDRPTLNELCLLVVEPSMQLTTYFKIGSIQPCRWQQIEIIGYPSASYRRQKQLFKVAPKRVHLKVNLKGADGFILQHNLYQFIEGDGVGLSGSPILVKGKNNQYYVVGMQSHQYQGLLFDEQVHLLIHDYQKQLTQQFCLDHPILCENDGDIDRGGCTLSFFNYVESLRDSQHQGQVNLDKIEQNQRSVDSGVSPSYPDQGDQFSQMESVSSKAQNSQTWSDVDSQQESAGQNQHQLIGQSQQEPVGQHQQERMGQRQEQESRGQEQESRGQEQESRGQEYMARTDIQKQQQYTKELEELDSFKAALEEELSEYETEMKV